MKINFFWDRPGWYANTGGGGPAVDVVFVCDACDDAENAFADSVEEGIRFCDALRRAGRYCAGVNKEIPVPDGDNDFVVWINTEEREWVLRQPCDVSDELLDTCLREGNTALHASLLDLQKHSESA